MIPIVQKCNRKSENNNKPNSERPADRESGHGVSSDSTIEQQDVLSFKVQNRMKLPYFKFMVSDWIAGNIQACSMETQGIYVNLLARIWRDGGCLSTAQAPLAKLLRIDEAVLQAGLDELVSLDIISVDDNCMTVKFMTEQIEEIVQDHENKVLAGKKGGLKSAQARAKQNQAQLKHTDTDTDTDKDIIEWDLVKSHWNMLAQKHGVKEIKTLSSERKKKYKSRISSIGSEQEFWAVVEKELKKLGSFAKEGTWFNFAWLIKSDENYTKFAEGNYRDSKAPTEERKPTPVKIHNDTVALIISEHDKRPVGERKAFLSSCHDKYRDIPKNCGLTATEEAIEIIRERNQ